MSYHTHTTHILDDYGVELDLEPCCPEYGGLIIEEVGDKLVVAYLVHDDSAFNPMTDHDCQGVLYTRSTRGWGGGSITDDDSAIYAALRLDGYGSVDIDREFTLDGKSVTLRELAADEMLKVIQGDEDLQCEWLEATFDENLVFDQVYPIDLTELRRDLGDCNGVFWEEVEALAVSLYSQHWQTIVGPYVVPVDYCESNHGPGTTTIHPTTWDGDADDPPTGVWVADSDAIENIETQILPEGVSIDWRGACGSTDDPLHAVVTKDGEVVFDSGTTVRPLWGRALRFVKDTYGLPTDDAALHRAAVEYATSVLSEYEHWCNGDVYGCVNQVFERQEDGTWAEVGDDACWGYIGFDYAKETLQSEYVDLLVKKWKATSEQGELHE